MKDNLWELSSTNVFVKDIVQDLRSGINIVVHIPKFNFFNFDQSLKDGLNEELHWFEMTPRVKIETPINYLIKEIFSESNQHIESIQELVEKMDSMKFLWINLDELTIDVQNQWLSFLNEYAIVCDQKDRFKRLVFIYNICSNSFSQELSSPFLKEHHFYNYVSELDFERVIYDSLISSNYSHLQINIIKSIIFEIAYPNFDLAYFLIDRVADINNFTLNLFKDYVTERNISFEKKILDKAKSSAKPEYLNVLSPVYFLWLNNLITFRNDKVEPSVLNYFLRGEDNHFFIWQRVWLAQIKVVFPLLEQYRIEIIEYLRDIGIAKELILSHNLEETKDIYNLEISDLFFLIVINKKVGVNKTTFRLIDILRAIRNELAHCKVVKYSKLEILFGAYADFDTMIHRN